MPATNRHHTLTHGIGWESLSGSYICLWTVHEVLVAGGPGGIVTRRVLGFCIVTLLTVFSARLGGRLSPLKRRRLGWWDT